MNDENHKLLTIANKIVTHNLNNYSSRGIVERLLKKRRNWKVLEENKLYLERDFNMKITKLSNIHNKNIKTLKKLLLNCKFFLERLNILINKGISKRFLISENKLLETQTIHIPKNSKINQFLYDTILNFNLKVKDINSETKLEILKQNKKEIELLIVELNIHYKTKYKIFKEKRILLRKCLDISIKEFESRFYKSNYFINEVDNYIIINNPNKMYNKDFILKLNNKYWNQEGKYKYPNLDKYILFLMDTWFK
jgi:hypothetical protein